MLHSARKCSFIFFNSKTCWDISLCTSKITNWIFSFVLPHCFYGFWLNCGRVLNCISYKAEIWLLYKQTRRQDGWRIESWRGMTKLGNFSISLITNLGCLWVCLCCRRIDLRARRRHLECSSTNSKVGCLCRRPDVGQYWFFHRPGRLRQAVDYVDCACCHREGLIQIRSWNCPAPCSPLPWNSSAC